MRNFEVKCIVSGLVALIASAQECDPTTGVCDMHERCSAWKDEGECLRNRAYMQKHCPVSCSEEATATSMIYECIDQHDRCKVWARLGECEANPVEMHKYCPRSCKVCSEQGVAIQDEEEEEFEEEDTCQDRDTRCGSWARSGECTSNPNYMHFNCAVSCGTCEKVTAVAAPKKTGKSATTSAYADNLMERSKKFGELQQATGADRERVLSRIESTISYLASDEVGQLSANIRRECKNRHELCSFWQVIGECEKNKAYMQTNCAAACQSCKMIDHSTRCPPLPDAVPGLIPGGVNQMFERIVRTAPGNRTDMMDEEFRALEESKIPLYSVHVHSRPSEEPLTEVSVAQDKALPPWVITFDNFLTDEECENLIELGYKYGYKRSEDVGGVRFDGTFDSVQSSSRTSENAWCSHTECRDEEVPKRLHERMAKVMGIPPEHSEDLQGQFYRTHHDYIGHQKERQCGPRILTFFFYLSDVEKGGGTNFPDLDLTVEPKKGRALLWPSVLDSDPTSKDSRMNHQALPVEEGTKFAANGWIHLYDYVGPQLRGCN